MRQVLIAPVVGLRRSAERENETERHGGDNEQIAEPTPRTTLAPFEQSDSRDATQIRKDVNPEPPIQTRKAAL
jgi:hypothetical protein